MMQDFSPLQHALAVTGLVANFTFMHEADLFLRFISSLFVLNHDVCVCVLIGHLISSF